MKYSLHFITPVHVGSGLRLGKMDYVSRGSKVIVLDLRRLASLSNIDPEEFSEALGARSFDMETYLRSKGIDPSKSMAYSLDCIRPPSGEIICCLKDGTGRAYIPGSSLKGALRTAILWERIKGDPSKRKEAESAVISAIQTAGPRRASARAAQPLERLFLGRDPNGRNDPNYDHLRVLKVSDSISIPSDCIRLSEIAVMNLVGQGLTTKMTLFVEAFKPGTKTEISLNMDEFLTRQYVRSRLNLKVDDLMDLEKTVGSYYSDYIKAEIDFFSKYGKPDIVAFYKQLLTLPEKKKGGMLLRAGFGSGWHGMTVARRFPDLVPRIQQAFRLGRQGVAEFPKTRKLALMGPDEKHKMMPMGWMWAAPS